VNTPTFPSLSSIKLQAKLIREAIQSRCQIEVKHADALEILAKSYGLPDWNTLKAKLEHSAEITVPRKPLRATDPNQFESVLRSQINAYENDQELIPIIIQKTHYDSDGSNPVQSIDIFTDYNIHIDPQHGLQYIITEDTKSSISKTGGIGVFFLDLIQDAFKLLRTNRKGEHK